MTHDRYDLGAASEDDRATEQIVHDLRERVRDLNRATAGPPGLTMPATAYAVLGALASAAYGLDQTMRQLDEFLLREHREHRLGHDHGADLDEALDAFSRAILHARHLTSGLGEAAGQAQSAIKSVNGLPRPDDHRPPLSTATPSARPDLEVRRPNVEAPPRRQAARPRWARSRGKGA
ncbi:hypothetical protein [Actinomadura sp. 3N407]|uniref:hypothetical protein n=1 Tax=Actinomadura sp. 3N407 TaxID=3457423 RepID=UPI003FCE3281